MKTAVIYTRVSTLEQVKKDLSIPYQIDRCKKFAKDNDYVVVGEFSDPGKSATNANRPDLQRMFTFMLEKKINALIVYKQDRLSRDMKDFWTMVKLKVHEIGLIISYLEGMCFVLVELDL